MQVPDIRIKVSLIVATRGRTRQLEVLLKNLTKQELQKFEVIIVDQNEDDRLVAILDPSRWPYLVRHVRTPLQRGLSRARNEGLRYAKGDIIVFPDDDCWYPAWFLAKGLALLDQHQCDCVTGRAADETGRSINGRFETDATWVDRHSVWTTQIEWAVFFRRNALVAIGGYDEALGVGSQTPWWANEGQDVTLRLLEAGFTTYYDPELYGFHDELNSSMPDADMIRKGRSYARGFGYVLRRHGYGLVSIGYWILRPATGALLSVMKRDWTRSRYYGNVVLGRLEGWLKIILPTS